jgi:ribosomal protein L4
MRAKALFMALSRKFKEGKIIFVDSFGIDVPKTAIAKNTLVAFSKIEGFSKMATKRKNVAVVALADGAEATRKSFRNIGNVECVAVRNLNPVTILGATYLIIENPEAAVAIVEDRAARLGTKSVEAKTSKTEK